MMQGADLRERDGSSYPAWLDRARVRTILVKRKMRAGALVIVDVRVENSAQMALIEDQDVIQALAANRTDRALDVSVLPR